MRKKWLARSVSMLLVLSLVGCNTTTTQPKPSQQTTNEESTNNTDLENEVEKENEDFTTEENSNTNDSSSENSQMIDENIEDEETEEQLDESQKNSVAMLNYLAFLSQEVNSSKNSRMFLEEAYASLINNTNPEKVNELTESHLSSLLDIIEKYRMVNVKRERLQYLYNQNKAKAIRQAMPNPIALLSATNARSLKQLAASAIYMAVDSYNSYKSYNDELDSEFLQEGWALDDEEDANLHDSRKRAFMYMVEIVREEGLPKELTLNENSVKDFVKCKNKENLMQKIQFLESEKNTYSSFGNYWILLSECYYQNNDYEKCIEAIKQYEKLEAEIFRKDYYLAKALPNVIVSAAETYSLNEYIPFAEKYLDILIKNTENTEWSLRTFAAQVYMDLFSRTDNKEYLSKAYDILLNNVNYLIGEQMVLNERYLNDVKEVPVTDSVTKDEKKKIKSYNKELKEKRKTELPPVYEPLKINCEMLFAVADELDISKTEQKKIDGMLNDSKGKVFLTKPLQNIFSFSSKEESIKSDFDEDTLILPANCLSTDSVIHVKVTDGGKSKTYKDWKVQEVERDSKDLKSFKVTYESEKIKKYDWSKDSTIKIEIYDSEDTNFSPVVINYKAKQKKFLGIFKTIDFVQVK